MRFRPSLVGSVTALFVAAVCVRLGFWQLSRYDTRTAEAERRQARHAAPALTRVAPPYDDLDYRRVSLKGRYESLTTATGGIPFSRNGYASIGLFRTDAGDAVLINRGWIPADVWKAHTIPPEGPLTVEGIFMTYPQSPPVNPLIEEGLSRWPLEREPFLGGLSRGVRIPYSSIAHTYGVDAPVIVIEGPELDDLEDRKTNHLPAGGYTTYLKTFHHLEYAVQWFAFAGIASLLWIGFGFRRGGRRAPASD